jgi:hypothetical protein
VGMIGESTQMRFIRPGAAPPTPRSQLYDISAAIVEIPAIIARGRGTVARRARQRSFCEGSYAYGPAVDSTTHLNPSRSVVESVSVRATNSRRETVWRGQTACPFPKEATHPRCYGEGYSDWRGRASKPLRPIQKSDLDDCGMATLKPTKSWALFSAQMASSSGTCTRRQRCTPS